MQTVLRESRVQTLAAILQLTDKPEEMRIPISLSATQQRSVPGGSPVEVAPRVVAMAAAAERWIRTVVERSRIPSATVMTPPVDLLEPTVRAYLAGVREGEAARPATVEAMVLRVPRVHPVREESAPVPAVV